jgi:hypothetical protein
VAASFIGNYYNYIWIGKRFFQSFLSGFTIAISARAQILTLALINLCIEDNNIYLNDANLNNTKDLATTLGHETSHAIDNQDPSIDTNPQNNTSKADNVMSIFTTFCHFSCVIHLLITNKKSSPLLLSTFA